MHRIHILGSSGTGKSTLAKALASRLDCPHFDADDYETRQVILLKRQTPAQNAQQAEQRFEMMLADVAQHSSWIISHSRPDWPGYPVLPPTLLVLMVVPPEIRLERQQRRKQERYGRRLEQDGDLYQQQLLFLERLRTYDGYAELQELPAYEALIAKQNVPVLRLIGALTLNEEVRLVEQQLTQGSD